MILHSFVAFRNFSEGHPTNDFLRVARRTNARAIQKKAVPRDPLYFKRSLPRGILNINLRGEIQHCHGYVCVSDLITGGGHYLFTLLMEGMCIQRWSDVNHAIYGGRGEGEGRRARERPNLANTNYKLLA